MPSYQDIETRLQQAERKLHFIMTALRMKGQINGMVGPDGKPVISDKNLLEWYRLVQQEVLDVESVKKEEVEKING